MGPRETFAVEKAGDWYLILDGPMERGYIHQDLVSMTGDKFPLAKNEATSIRVRSAPSLDGSIRGVLLSGEIFAGERKGEWYEIKDGRFRGGFASAEFIKTLNLMPSAKVNEAEQEPEPFGARLTVVSATPSPTPAPSAGPSPTPSVPPIVAVAVAAPNPYSKIIVSAETAVRIRVRPSVKSRIAGAVMPGEIFEAEQVGEWFEIKAGPRKGNFISAKFVKREAPLVVAGVAEVQAGAVAIAPARAPAPAPAPVAKPSAANPFGVEPVWNEAVEKRFQQQVANAFKKKGKHESGATEVIMPVFYEGHSRPIGQVQTSIIPGEALSIEATTIFKYLRQLVAESWFERSGVSTIYPEAVKAQKEGDARSWVSISKFENTGVAVTYNERRLEIHIAVPADLRSPTIASVLRSYGDQGGDEYVEPRAGFSAYLNVNASETIDSRFDEFADRRLPLKVQLESGTNLGGFALEAYGKYLEDRTGDTKGAGFTRDDVRIVRDFPDQILRSSVGDIVYPTQGFQTFRPMAGLSLTSNFAMSKSRLTYPTGDYELFLQRDSKIFIWVNDQLQQVLELPAGHHSLRDFPFVNGANELRLEIVDDVGRTETKHFSHFSSTELLRPKLQQYSYSVGAPTSTDANFDRSYDASNPTISAFHRYGLLESLTLGANFQQDSAQTIVGAEAFISSSLGFLKFEPAFSASKASGSTGGAFRTTYIYSDYKGPLKTGRSFTLGLSHRGSTFSSLGTSAENVFRQSTELRAGYAQGLSRNLSMNFSGALRRIGEAPDAQESFSLKVGASRRWSSGLSLSGNISHTRMPSGSEEISVLAFLLWSLAKERQVVTAVHNTADQSSRVDWSHSPSSGVGASNYNVAIRESASEQGYSGQIQNDGNRMRSSISQEVILKKEASSTQSASLPQSNGKKSDSVTTLYLASAIAYAGGHFAIGRPVTDSFAIVAPIKNLRGQRLDINPNSEDSYVANSDALGPALVPELGSYTRTDIKLGAKHIPSHLALPRDHFSIYPSYKSGYAFESGTDATVYVQAKLLGPDGVPLSLAAGRAVYLDDSDQEPVTIFTNKSGVLRSEGFRIGRYRLEIATDSFAPLEITVGESAVEVLDLGTLQLKVKQQ